MITINKRKLWRAFSLNGWLDTQTGEIIEARAREEADGEYRYQLSPEVLNNQERYRRIPYISAVQTLLAYIEHEGIDSAILQKYGIDTIDTEKLKGGQVICHAPFRDQICYNPEEYVFLDRFHRLEEDLDLDLDNEFIREYQIKYMNQWCEENGYSLEGEWTLP